MSVPTIVGRGVAENPKNRFEKLELSPDLDELDFELQTGEKERPQTDYYKDSSKTLITYNDSPDIGYSASVNPYRGCSHGCVYCYARPTHEYLGFSAGLDFETKVMVKTDAPVLLRKELSAKNWQPQMVGFSGVTDIYQPIEKQLNLTRQCLEVFLDFRNPVGMVTKNYLITRDLDLLQELAKFHCVSVCISVTTLDDGLRRLMEPRTSSAKKRLEAVSKLAVAGVHVGVLTAPIIPGLTDHEIPALVQAAKDAGAKFVGYTIVHLPYGVKDIFAAWVKEHYPERADKILNRIKAMRGGKLNDPRFGARMSGEGIFAEQIAQLYKAARKKAGFEKSTFKLSTEHFRVPGRSVQIGLFE
ncbi:MAG: PA0069 family radical SAM protein [Trueperaceae bacterium]